jgi:hypothetical protein
MPFVKGQSGNANGRPRGAVNKTTASAKQAFQMAFDKLGGWERLAKWATEDPDNLKAFYSLYARLIPVDVTTGGNPIPAPVITLAHAQPQPQPEAD